MRTYKANGTHRHQDTHWVILAWQLTSALQCFKKRFMCIVFTLATIVFLFLIDTRLTSANSASTRPSFLQVLYITNEQSCGWSLVARQFHSAPSTVYSLGAKPAIIVGIEKLDKRLLEDKLLKLKNKLSFSASSVSDGLGNRLIVISDIFKNFFQLCEKLA